MTFTTALEVRIGDINYGQHLAHDRLIGLLHEARLRFLASLGASEQDFFTLGLIMKNLQVSYKNEAFYGEVLDFHLTVSKLAPVRFTLDYQVYCQARLIASASTEMVAFDYRRRKVQPLPAEFRARAEALMGVNRATE